MRGKRPPAEQIVNKLRQAEVLLAQGQTVAQISKTLGITDQTYYRWRKEYGREDRPGQAAQGPGTGERPAQTSAGRGRAGQGDSS